MATQATMGLSKALILLGAGFTGSVLMKNGKLSDILGELQGLLKSVEKSGDGGDGENSALISQLDRLAREVQRMSSSRSVTVISANPGFQGGNLSSLIIPAASLGALGYGYMWWKGLSFSDLMYVTKQNMANAVSSMTKHLEQVSAALAATKRHLTQRIENLDGKLDEQKEMSKDIKNEVLEARGKLSTIGNELSTLQELVWGLNGKMEAIEGKQNFACEGVMYLCQFVSAKGGKVPDSIQNAYKASGKRGFIGFNEGSSLKGLQQITNAIESVDHDKKKTNTGLQIEV